MTDSEKFAGFKQKLVDENEKAYGSEVRKAYGDEAVDASNRKLLDLSEMCIRDRPQRHQNHLRFLHGHQRGADLHHRRRPVPV